ncbi:MAG: hypothetical protein LUM44_07895 [Pyrinomonadaceae bacterium]|nr:hypothetical protein [Pyrinomonadaceae bacterium]
MKEQKESIQKAPYYVNLSNTLIEKTDDMIHDLKRGLPSDKRRKLNRSKFFELLLEQLVFDYETQHPNSTAEWIITKWHNNEE